jgi:hypothetical protein
MYIRKDIKCSHGIMPTLFKPIGKKGKRKTDSGLSEREVGTGDQKAQI